MEEGLNGYLVEEGGVQEMGNKIVELYFDRDKAENFGIKGKKIIQERFFKKTTLCR